MTGMTGPEASAPSRVYAINEQFMKYMCTCPTTRQWPVESLFF